LSLLALAALAALGTGGCQSSGSTIEIHNPAEFQSVAVDNPKPTLVLFYKQGCASCLALMPTIDKLAQEYQGRAMVGQFMILTFTFGVTSQELKDRYEVALVPHVVLLVNGKVKDHWTMEYDIDAYRKGLDAAISSGAAETVPPKP
jgi:thioredoxin 1